MKPQLPQTGDPLLRLLDEWQVKTEPSAGFDQNLRRDIAAAEARRGAALLPRAWESFTGYLRPHWPVAAGAIALALVMAVTMLARLEQKTVPAATPAVQTAQMDPVMRDLQALDRDGDLLDHLDFLSAPASAAAPRSQDRDE